LAIASSPFLPGTIESSAFKFVLMTTLLPIFQTAQTAISPKPEVVYPSSDGEPLAETSVHIDAIINAVIALRNYLEGEQAIVLADQFLYYAEGFPKLRVAPDIMVVVNVPPGARDNYKVWEEGQVPAVIFEMTSAGTKNRDEIDKKYLYESLNVPEYWQFDPKGEWIPEKLRGYRLQDEVYVPITDRRSEVLRLRLEVNESLIAFYREDTGEKLLASEELVQALRQETLARQEAEALLDQEQQRADRLAARLRELGEDPDLV
jgi:Putative restriction endonuclease